MNSAKNAWYHGSIGVRPDAEPDVAGGGAQHAHDGEGPGDRSGDLRRDVRGHLGPRNLPVAARPNVTAGLMWLPLM